jgi:hypothetical protein
MSIYVKKNASHSHVFATPFLLLFSLLDARDAPEFPAAKNHTAITNQLEYILVYM